MVSAHDKVPNKIDEADYKKQGKHGLDYGVGVGLWVGDNVLTVFDERIADYG